MISMVIGIRIEEVAIAMEEALGMVKTKGLVASMEAVDAMIKVENIILLGYEKTGHEMVTVMVRGDMNAVKASVDAGTIAAKKVGEVVSTDIIVCPDGNISNIFYKAKVKGSKKTGVEKE